MNLKLHLINFVYFFETPGIITSFYFSFPFLLFFRPLVTIRWFKDNTEIRSSSSAYRIGPTGQKLTVVFVTQASAGRYRCEISNRLGTRRSESQLRVESEYSIF